MCGIIGTYSYKSRDNNQKFIKWGMNQMIRRGPDSDGYLNIGDVHLGFRRLAIQDVNERANQPIYSKTHGSALVFNGEIYNVNYLKSKLDSKIKFKTSSDTEVLFYCLIFLGPEKTLPLLDGIFAFAFYNKNSDVLFLARDRAGVKPLYYGISNETFVFCSEYNVILCHPSFNNPFNIDAITHYLQLGFLPEGESIYKNTFLLPHGYSLEIKKNKPPILSRYYNYHWQIFNKKTFDISNVISESVEAQLVSDVPVGLFQSGGIDSSLISFYAKMKSPCIESFTIGVQDKNIDESIEAQSFADLIGLKNNLQQIDISDTLFELIKQNNEAFSEPFADYSSLPTLLLSQFARKKITVALAGDGGDELFWGYSRNVQTANYISIFKGNLFYRLIEVLKNRYNTNPVKAPFKTLLFRSILEYGFNRTFITGAHSWCQRIFNNKPEPPFLLKELILEIENNQHLTENELMNIIRKIEFDFHLQRVLLKVDRASSYHSLEVRVPLLSNQMLDASLQHSYNNCVNGLIGKIPLRKTLEQCVSSHHSNLPKKGFTIPLDTWLKGILSKHIKERVLDLPGDFSYIFNKKEIEKLLISLETQNNGWLVWALFALFEWSDKKLSQKKFEFLNYNDA